MTQKGRKCIIQIIKCFNNESFADGCVGAGVRLMVRGGCLTMRRRERVAWTYDDDKCGSEQFETEKHVLIEFLLYGETQYKNGGGLKES